MGVQEGLQQIFHPESIAVVGTNRKKGTVPHDIFANLLQDNFQGVLYPVSPGEHAISGVKAYKYIVDIEDPVDLAVIVFPSSVMHLAMKQLGEKGVKSAIIISAGFREVGEKGKEREEQIKEIAAEHDIHFIGPNCLGVINTAPAVHMNASFARKMPEEGNIAFLSQSGALCTAVLDYARSKHIGFSKFISFGNKADINEIDLLRYLKDDPKTDVILIYLEEISDGRALMDVAQEIISETGKPILTIKAGRTEEGATAAASHTGSLAGSDEVCDAALRQAGIIRCTTIEEMFNKAIALAYQPIPSKNRVAIITNAGGPGVLAADAAVREDLELASFNDETTEIFKKHLPSTANIKNPVDVIGDARADRYRVAVSTTMKDDNVDGTLVILTPQSMTDIEAIAEAVVEVGSHESKPLYASFMGEADVATGIDILQRHKIPHYILPESMCSAFTSAYQFHNIRQRDTNTIPKFADADTKQVSNLLEEAQTECLTHLPEMYATPVLKAYGFPTLPGGIATSAEDAVKMAQEVGYPVVMKIMSKDIVHKIDIGGIVLNVISEDEVHRAYQYILKNAHKSSPDAEIDGIYVQKMVTGGEEVILGIKRDPSFGPVVMFGLGGTYVEVFHDVSFRVAPFGPGTADAMIHETTAYNLLSGIRGKSPRDVSALSDALQRLAQLAVDFPMIQELDINPFIVLDDGEGGFAADARIMLSKQE